MRSKAQNVFALRLLQGADLKKSIAEFASLHHLKAGYIITCVGSLRKINLRYAGKDKGAIADGKFEIVSLAGTFSVSGIHLHISVADEAGKVIGGHLLDENIIYTTAEIVIGNAEGLIFEREDDASTGYKELVIKESK